MESRQTETLDSPEPSRKKGPTQLDKSSLARYLDLMANTRVAQAGCAECGGLGLACRRVKPPTGSELGLIGGGFAGSHSFRVYTSFGSSSSSFFPGAPCSGLETKRETAIWRPRGQLKPVCGPKKVQDLIDAFCDGSLRESVFLCHAESAAKPNCRCGDGVWV